VAARTAPAAKADRGGPKHSKPVRCRADDLDIDSWSSFLRREVLSEPDETNGARLLNGRPIEASDQRALYRWLSERNRPSIWRADKLLIRYGAHIDEFFLYCEEHGLQPWASGQAPDWYRRNDVAEDLAADDPLALRSPH
jgi:hypothetical protein